MGELKDRRQGDTALPARNFTLTTAERARALVTGPPPYALRLRRIEDLESAIVRDLVAHDARTGSLVNPGTGALPFPIAQKLAQLNALIDAHNRYYPIEKQLPMEPRTRQFVDWNEPWTPMPPVAAETLIARARAARR